MKVSTRQFTVAILSLLTLAGTASYAQTAERVQKKKELLKEMMREKFHLQKEALGAWAGEEEEKTTIGYDQRVSTNPSGIGEGEISVAYNPTDSNLVVLSFMQQSSGGLVFPIYYSSDGGVTWAKSTFNSIAVLNSDFPGQLAAGGGDPAFAWDKNGKLYYSWIYLSVPSTFDTGYFSLNWASSVDSGKTWGVTAKHFIGRGAIDLASGNTLPFMDGITDREWLAVDNSGGAHQGNVYCSFVCFPAGTASAYEGIKRLIPGIDTFGNAVPAYMGNTQFGNVEVDKNGILHMSFADIDNSQIRHVASTDGGTSFGSSQVIANASTIFPAGPSYVFHNRENAAVNMSVDGSTGTGNNVHVVWSDFPGTTAVSYYSHSTDAGATWSVPDTLNKRFGNQPTLMPTVAAAGNNVTISVSALTGADSTWYYQLGSVDNGATFGGPILTSALPTRYLANGANTSSSSLFFGDYNRSVRTQCQVYATWSDGRNNTAKVYFARKNFCTLGVQEVTSVNDGVQLAAVYPNPASGMVNLKVSAATAQHVVVELYDMAGRKVTAQNNTLKSGMQEIALPLHGIAKGAYVLSLQSGGSVIATRSVVVQ